MIIAEGLSKSYHGRRAIENVSFKINDGEIVGLLGLNGAGKSTILKILGGFLMPSTGKARVAGFAVDEQPQAVRKVIGYLPDTPPLYDEMTVRAYLQYVAKLKDVAAPAVQARVDSVVQRTNLQKVLDMRLGELSHGFRQRVGIAQALVHEPRVLILDEPINGLDPVQIVEMRDLIVSLRGHHTLILSSHILSEITRTCDRILIVDQGRLVAEGSEKELAESLVQSMQLQCEIKQLVAGLEAKLSSLAGILGVTVAVDGKGGARLTLKTDSDVRAQVSEVIVSSGAGLLSMNKIGGGLEGLFMKLVRSGGGVA